MKTILITGVTGFVGSSLAANFLLRGEKVVALSRNDPQGLRTIEAVKFACEGFNIPESSINWSNLVVAPIDFQKVGELALNPILRSIHEVWHVAAEMTYSSKKFVGAFYQNMTVTGELYQVLNDFSPDCNRFYYVSTAYTGGFKKSVIEEKIHTNPHIINVYQGSKWATETSLYLRGQESRLPVTIFRPSIVIGHEHTGWTGSNNFGMYSLVAAIMAGIEHGAREITLDLNEQVKSNMIPINDLVENAINLSRTNDKREKVEIFNAIADESLSMSTCLKIVSDILNAKVVIGRPKTMYDKVVHTVGHHNMAFARTDWVFKNDRLTTVLGNGFKSTVMTEEKMRKIIAIWVTNRRVLQPQSKRPVVFNKVGFLAKIAIAKFRLMRSFKLATIA